MKLLRYNVVVPFDLDSVPQHLYRNQAVELWWDIRKKWLQRLGAGSWSAYRIADAYLVVKDCGDPPAGNNNSGEIVVWTFDDAKTAALFKLAWG